ncbi:hypothetical protein [Streptomyces sp. NPDC059564]|uniref:hypothetical protein n=1 Tax=Streptomyces sp. NPDC059564 TaxID=3346865 RepID=UPI00368D3D3A
MAELHEQLQQLWSTANKSFRNVAAYGKRNGVKLSPSTVKGWLGGVVPDSTTALTALVEYLETAAERESGWQRLPGGEWAALYRAAHEAKVKARQKTSAPATTPQRASSAPTLQNSTSPAQPGDIEKARRILKAFPLDASWFTSFEHQASFHRIHDSVQDPLYDGQNVLARNYKVRFLDPDLQRQSEKFHDTVNAFLHSLDHMDADGKSGYSQIPTEWRRSFRDQYESLLRKLSGQRDELMTEYGALINLFNERGIPLLPNGS